MNAPGPNLSSGAGKPSFQILISSGHNRLNLSWLNNPGQRQYKELIKVLQSGMTGVSWYKCLFCERKTKLVFFSKVFQYPCP
jgi:hypothetical protein